MVRWRLIIFCVPRASRVPPGIEVWASDSSCWLRYSSRCCISRSRSARAILTPDSESPGAHPQRRRAKAGPTAPYGGSIGDTAHGVPKVGVQCGCMLHSGRLRGDGPIHAPPAPSAPPPLPSIPLLVPPLEPHPGDCTQHGKCARWPSVDAVCSGTDVPCCRRPGCPGQFLTMSAGTRRGREPKEWRTSEEDSGVGRQSEWVRVAPGQNCTHRQAGSWPTSVAAVLDRVAHGPLVQCTPRVCATPTSHL